MNGRAYYLTTLAEWRQHACRFGNSHWVAADPEAALAESLAILVLVEADEGAHLVLEKDPGFEALPHPLSAKAVPEHVAESLSGHGVARGVTTFEVAEAIARAHPMLRHRVF